MINYKDAGVDVHRGYEAVKLMKDHVKRTTNEHVKGGLGSFGAIYDLAGYTLNKPMLVSGTDGVGTKLKIAIMMDKHDTVGIDCVAMCVNDVVCQGAKPLFFLDYIATEKVAPEKIADIVGGIAEGCVQAGCALVGGETAEMPGFYAKDDYDMAGFCVGLADGDKIMDGTKVKPGDVLVGLASSGVHSNGFSLVRKLLVPDEDALSVYVDELGSTLGEELIKPTRIYVKSILSLMEAFDIHGAAHITGGGFIENIPRIFPEDVGGEVDLGAWPVPPVFNMLRRAGGMDDASIYNTFNMGIGMVLAVAAEDADAVCAKASALGEKAYVIGRVVKGEGLKLCGGEA